MASSRAVLALCLSALTRFAVADESWTATKSAHFDVLTNAGEKTGARVALQFERIRALFAALETKEAMVRLLEAADLAQGVQIFIGAQNELFGLAGCSVIIAPYRNSREQIVGAVGVIGPTRINYARIIPMVDYTAQVIGRILA